VTGHGLLAVIQEAFRIGDQAADGIDESLDDVVAKVEEFIREEIRNASEF
jgi:hypothetical protein